MAICISFPRSTTRSPFQVHQECQFLPTAITIFITQRPPFNPLRNSHDSFRVRSLLPWTDYQRIPEYCDLPMTYLLNFTRHDDKHPRPKLQIKQLIFLSRFKNPDGFSNFKNIIRNLPSFLRLGLYGWLKKNRILSNSYNCNRGTKLPRSIRDSYLEHLSTPFATRMN